MSRKKKLKGPTAAQGCIATTLIIATLPVSLIVIGVYFLGKTLAGLSRGGFK